MRRYSQRFSARGPALQRRIETQLALRQRGRVRHLPAQQLSGPGRLHRRNVIAPERVLLRLVDRVVLTFEIIDREAHGERLHVCGLGLFGRTRLAGLTAALETGHVLGFGQRQQIALLGRVNEVCGVDGSRSPDSLLFTVTERMESPLTSAAVGLCCVSSSSEPPQHTARACLQHRKRHPRFVRNLRDTAVAGIQIPASARLGRERIVLR